MTRRILVSALTLFTAMPIKKVTKGRRMTVRGDGQKEEYRTVKADREDIFDQWNDRRNRQLAMEPAYRGLGAL